MNTAKEWVEAMAQFMGNASVMRFVSDAGQDWIPAAKPKSVQWGRRRECFANAARLALRGCGSGLIYVEGWATSPNLGIAIHHGWVVGPSGEVIDNTWRDPGTSYFGVAFSTNYLRARLLEQGYFGLLEPCCAKSMRAIMDLVESSGSGAIAAVAKPHAIA